MHDKFLNYLKESIAAWTLALKSKSFAIKLMLVPGIFFLYSAITQKLGTYIEMRKGVLLNDYLLNLFPRHDFSIEIFLLLYSSIFIVLITHLNKPKVIYRIIEMHLLVAVVRQLCILLVALEPPTGIIVLRDVFLENTVYPRLYPLTKDLFFSGHIASTWIYFLVAQVKWVKWFMIVATCLMAFMILSMRVHYTIDA
ncbi:MAG: hypothetical protein IT215_07510 [Chitinophagaceae bacterium]|nr:hypothetical protein [Chitinophagaceae bacterium]